MLAQYVLAAPLIFAHGAGSHQIFEIAHERRPYQPIEGCPYPAAPPNMLVRTRRWAWSGFLCERV